MNPVKALARVGTISLARSFNAFLPGKAAALLKENLTIVRRMDYAPQPILLNIESSLEYNVRLKSCAKEPETVKWIEEFVKEGDTFYDVGANVGAYSLVAAKAIRGNVKVYAFEPAFPNFAQLCHNIYLNGCGDSIVPLPIALSDKTVLDNLNYNNLMPGGALHAVGEPVDFKGREFGPVFKQGVLSYRLDDVVRQFALDPPNHVKIDVDGIELSILQGATETLSGTSLRSILVEVEEGREEPTDMVEYLRDKGFTLKERHKYVYGEDWKDLSQVFNYLFVRDGTTS